MSTSRRFHAFLLSVIVGLGLTLFYPADAAAQGPITNGETRIGTISVVGETDTWTFAATAGDAIIVRVGEVVNTAFTPRIQLLSPTSVLLGNNTGTSAAEISVTAPNTGTFTIRISDSAGTQTNSYRLTLAKTGSAVVVSPEILADR